MLRNCYRCPAHYWLRYNKDAACRLGYKVIGYSRPSDCPKKPQSNREMFILVLDKDRLCAKRGEGNGER